MDDMRFCTSHSSPAQAILQVQPVYGSREEWLALAKKEGLSFEVLELSMPPVINSAASFRECMAWYRNSRRVFSVHGAFIDVNPASSDESFRALSQKRCESSCAAALELGAENIVFHSSCFPFLRGAYLDNWAGICAEYYERLAEKYSLRILIENSPDVDPEPLKALMKRISDPLIGICLDLGHANYSRMPIQEWLDILGERICYLHLSDNNGMFDDHLPLGDGTVDWSAVSRFWQDKGKTVPMTFETGKLEGVIKSIEYLKEHKLFGME